jgi:N-methylhydantoinase A/oxoprolinase/acetone carboxylase beta subunit
MTLLLGIDTGGTYTDAVLCDEDGPGTRLVAKAKALTTPDNLSEGIGAAVARVLAGGAIDPAAIALVSVSTTLATNALVEGRGGRVCLVFIGFAEADLERGSLPDGLAGDPVIRIDGGHSHHGEPRAPLDLEALARGLDPIAGTVEGFAVVGHFAVRNPAHEIAARDLIRERTGLPVTCGHELSAQLNGPKRALTCVLNARLIGMIAALVDATEATLAARGIAAPLMLVRGDGSLVSAGFARARPIETILSGPAASLIGAAHLTGLGDAVIADIGGTTTDIAVLRDGRPALSPDGAIIGGFHTMVEAVAMVTHGLGGDSEVAVDDRARRTRLRIGPRRLIPVSLLGRDHPEIVREALERQGRRDNPGEFDGRFLLANPRLRGRDSGLREAERRLLGALGDAPVAQDLVITRRLQTGALSRLVTLGFVRISGFTPSDAAHVLGLHDAWDGATARRAAVLFARRRDARAEKIAASPEALSQWVVATLVRRSAEVLLGAALANDGLGEFEAADSKLIAAALDGAGSATRLDIGVDLPVVGLGASAPVYYPRIAAALGARAVIPEHADVANAVGAVVGRVEVRREITILPSEAGGFRVLARPDPIDFVTLPEAVAHARGLLREAARDEAVAAGAAEVELRDHFDEKSVMIDGASVFVEGTLGVRATGRPRLRQFAAGPRKADGDRAMA